MMKKINSIQLAWLRSFLITISFIMAFLLAFFFFVRVSVEKESLERNYSESRFLKTVIDEKFTSIPLLAADIVAKSTVMTPLYSGYDTLRTPEMYSLVNELNSMLTSNKVIKDVLIYYPKYDHVVGQLGSYPSHSYYFLKGLTTQDYPSWVSEGLNGKKQGFFSYNVDDKPVLMYSRSLIVGKNEDLQYKIIFEINQQVVTQILEQSNAENPNQLVTVLGDDNKPYAFAGNEQLVEYSKMAEPSEHSYNKRVGEHFITYEKSEISGIKYLMVNSKSDVLQLSSNITVVLLICLVACSLAGLVLALFFSAKNARPINLLLKKMQSSPTDDVTDAFAYINDKVNEMLVKNSSALEQLEQQQNLLTSTFVQTVIASDSRDEKAIGALSDIYGVNLENMYFSVLILSPLASTDKVQFDAIDVTVYNFLKEKSSESFAVYDCKLNDELVLILNYDCDADFVDPLTAFIKELFDFMTKNSVNCRIGAGGIYKTCADLQTSYEEAQRMLEQAPQGWLYYEKSQKRPALSRTDDGRKSFTAFEHYVEQGDYEQALSLLDMLIDNYLLRCKPSETKYRRHAIINDVYDAVITEVHEKCFSETAAQKCSELLFSTHTNKEAASAVAVVLAQLKEATQSSEEPDNSIASKSKTIIDSTYANPLLGLASIADQLGVSPSYISRVFKKEYEQGVVEYISRLRIENAKKLITQGEMNIKAIALSVGFSSDVSFIRVFKKYENITPGKYTAQ